MGANCILRNADRVESILTHNITYDGVLRELRTTVLQTRVADQTGSRTLESVIRVQMTLGTETCATVLRCLGYGRSEQGETDAEVVERCHA